MNKNIKAALLVGVLMLPSARAQQNFLQMALPGFDQLGDMKSITDTLQKACGMVKNYPNMEFICTVAKTANYVESLMDGASWEEFGNELLANFIGAQIAGIDTGSANQIANDLFDGLKKGVKEFKQALTKLSMTSFTATFKPRPDDDETMKITKSIIVGSPSTNAMLAQIAKEVGDNTAAKGDLAVDMKDAADAYKTSTEEMANMVKESVKTADKINNYNNMVKNATSTRELMEANVLATADMLAESKTSTMSLLGTLNSMLKQQVVTNKILNAQVQKIYDDKLKEVGDLQAEIQAEILEGQQKQKHIDALMQSNNAVSLADFFGNTGNQVLNSAQAGF